MADDGVAYRQNLTIGIITTCLALSTLTFGLRIYSRIVSGAKLWWDDYWMCGVMVVVSALSAALYAGE